MMPAGSPLPPSLWAATAETAPDCPPLRGIEEAEVVIVGGGFTGLSAALHLAESGVTVRLLEAAEPGWGASGRNGGQINPGWKILPSEIRERYGQVQADGVIRMADATCDLVFELIERHDIACDAIRPGFVYGAIGPRAVGTVERWVADWSALGAPVELLDRRAAAELLGTETYDAALLDRRGGNLQPLSYARGLAKAAKAAGALLHGASPAIRIEADGAGWRVSGPEGEVRARWVLLCTNGYSDALWPGLSQSVVPVMSLIAATKPLDGNLLKGVLPSRHAVSEAQQVMVYYRRDAADRFVIGGRSRWGRPDERGDLGHIKKTALGPLSAARRGRLGIRLGWLRRDDSEPHAPDDALGVRGARRARLQRPRRGDGDHDGQAARRRRPRRGDRYARAIASARAVSRLSAGGRDRSDYPRRLARPIGYALSPWRVALTALSGFAERLEALFRPSTLLASGITQEGYLVLSFTLR